MIGIFEISAIKCWQVEGFLNKDYKDPTTSKDRGVFAI
jgi:hypothetical protein